jgi:hypothetical protein
MSVEKLVIEQLNSLRTSPLAIIKQHSRKSSSYTTQSDSRSPKSELTTSSNPWKEKLLDHFGISMNFSNLQKHVPEVEKNNRVIKERIQATYHHLPYKQLRRLMTKILVINSAKKLNFFPAKQGILSSYSPRMILHKKNLGYF